MKRLLKFGLFESRSEGFPTDRDEIARICKMYGISNYDIRFDGTVDVRYSVNLAHRRLERLPLRFGKVGGSFYCEANQLTSLVGAPEEVGGDFHCQLNGLTSLEGSPKMVGKDFSCYQNQLTSLVGAPKEVGGDFVCTKNRLTSLEGAPETVRGNFECYDNLLTSLVGGPRIVDGTFWCHYNRLTNLVGAPEIVRGDFHCYGNRLVSLEGAPDVVGGKFICGKIFKTIMDRFGFYSEFRKMPEFNLPYGLFETYELFQTSLDEENWLQGDTIIRDRLEYAVEFFGKKGLPIPDKIEGYVIK